MKKKYGLGVCLMGLAFSCKALVYQCVKPDGGFEFRDTPCKEVTSQEHTFLPITYHMTEKESDKKIDKKPEKNNVLTEKQQAVALRKEERLKAKQTKKVLEEQYKEKRRLEKMAQLSEKIQKIEAELKAGCKIKRYNRLQKELKQCQDRQQGLRAYKSK